jgi:hypothetical protein
VHARRYVNSFQRGYGGVEELARLLGIAVGEQLHRALEISEEDRHLLAAMSRAGKRLTL